MDLLPGFYDLVRLVLQALSLAIILRIVLSWSPTIMVNTFTIILHRITEPILEPLRRIIPRAGVFDFTPLVAIIILQLLVNLTYRLG